MNVSWTYYLSEDADPEYINGIFIGSVLVSCFYKVMKLSDTRKGGKTSNFMRMEELYERKLKSRIHIIHSGNDIYSCMGIIHSYFLPVTPIDLGHTISIDRVENLYYLPVSSNSEKFIEGIQYYFSLLRRHTNIVSLPSLYLDNNLIPLDITPINIFELPMDIIRIIVSYCPGTCIRVNAYFYALASKYLLPEDVSNLIASFIRMNNTNALHGLLKKRPKICEDNFRLALNMGNLEICMSALRNSKEVLNYLLYARSTSRIDIYIEILRRLTGNHKLNKLLKVCYRDELLEIFLELLASPYIGIETILGMISKICKDDRVEWLPKYLSQINIDKYRGKIRERILDTYSSQILEILVEFKILAE